MKVQENKKGRAKKFGCNRMFHTRNSQRSNPAAYVQVLKKVYTKKCCVKIQHSLFDELLIGL